MTEIFKASAVIGDPVPVFEEDGVVHLLASLPESFNILVTALKANPYIPKMENVTEHLVHEEQKIKGQEEMKMDILKRCLHTIMLKQKNK